ncbi:hypothetical protein [Jejuia spongiicola]|uniref:SdiA-regulated family protein n=1 Tax=Jejuia spongiicola TaxID=2942207 RepID=A0ABT0QAR7_9FLAO|nr:hypothetical protein [Jejuia spongiicola]MCL6294028.1 hypothetical protein [Jejuia spongiicola]
MNKFLLSFILLTSSCSTGNLKIIADLPKALNEASGIETNNHSDLIWMVNDGGNASKLFGLSSDGKIKKVLKINAKNNDWEDLASDKEGNIYIGDFGNNANKRKNLAILKISVDSLNNKGKINIERISFNYPNQNKFPPKKKHLYFDSEAFFHFNDSLYIFTKSRVKGDFGKTDLYRIPAKQGKHIAEYISSFNSCPEIDCWITSADISDDGKKVVLLNSKSVWVFIDFKETDFFSGKAIEFLLNHNSQKESICFKNKNTLYISDEKAHGVDGNLYKLEIN